MGGAKLPLAVAAGLVALCGLAAWAGARSPAAAGAAATSLLAHVAAPGGAPAEPLASPAAHDVPAEAPSAPVGTSTVVNDNNLTKMTWACTDPIAAQEFFLKYVPSHKALDGCDPYCRCGVQGRVTINGTSEFGLHATNDMHHPSGTLSVADIERIFTEKFVEFSEYTDVMDYHAGLWTPNLDSTISGFRRAGVPFLPLKWTGIDEMSYYSVLVAVPLTTIVLEFVGTPPSANALEEGEALSVAIPRCGQSLVGLAESERDSHDMTPLWISRASSDADRDANWYARHFDASTLLNETGKDNNGDKVQYRYLIINPSNYIYPWELHFVQRAPSAVGGMTVADIEGYYKEVHRSSILSPVCGFDTWMDNHFGLDIPPDYTSKGSVANYYLDKLMRSLDTESGNVYRLYKQMALDAGVLYAIYVVEPSGHAVQLNGFLGDAPDEVPTWNSTLCGQGFCKNGIGGGFGDASVFVDDAATTDVDDAAPNPALPGMKWRSFHQNT